MVMAMDMAKDDPIVASETQVVLNQEDLVTTVVPNTLQSGVQLIENHVSTARRKDISQNSATPELTLNLHSASLGKT